MSNRPVQLALEKERLKEAENSCSDPSGFVCEESFVSLQPVSQNVNKTVIVFEEDHVIFGRRPESDQKAIANQAKRFQEKPPTQVKPIESKSETAAIKSAKRELPVVGSVMVKSVTEEMTSQPVLRRSDRLTIPTVVTSAAYFSSSTSSSAPGTIRRVSRGLQDRELVLPLLITPEHIAERFQPIPQEWLEPAAAMAEVGALILLPPGLRSIALALHLYFDCIASELRFEREQPKENRSSIETVANTVSPLSGSESPRKVRGKKRMKQKSQIPDEKISGKLATGKSVGKEVAIENGSTVVAVGAPVNGPLAGHSRGGSISKSTLASLRVTRRDSSQGSKDSRQGNSDNQQQRRYT